MAYRSVGKSMPRGEGGDKVTGRIRYTADVPVEEVLWGKVLRSPIPHGRITNVDKSKAEALNGVHAVLSGADLPPVYVGTRMKDMPVLATDRVRFFGDPVAAVAAETKEIAEEALSLIDVTYEDLPGVYDPVEATKPGTIQIHENRSQYKNAPEVPEGVPNLQSYTLWKGGNVEAGFQAADRIFEHTFRTQLTHHGYIEPHSCVVRIQADGKIEIWASNKAPYSLRQQFAGDVGVPADKVKVHIMPVGGDFGAKASLLDVPICYFLAKTSGRPVKVIFEHSEDIMAGGHRHPSVTTLRTGVKNDGTLTAIEAKTVYSGGAYAACKANPHVTVLAGRRLASTYRVPGVRAESICAYTNQVPCTQTRTPGSPQLVFALESQLDIIAGELGLDPITFRKRNLLRDGDTGPMGQKWQHILLGKTFDQALKASGWKKSKPGKFRGRGIALYERGAPEGKASTAITLEADGKVTVLTGVPDVGPGFYVVAQQIVAETLGIDPRLVQIRFQDTDSLPYDPGTGGSKTTNTTGHAVYQAAREVRGKLAALAARKLGCKHEEIKHDGGKFRGPDRKTVSVNETIGLAVKENGGPLFHLTNYEPKDMPPITGFAAQVAEVEVDPATGKIVVKKITTAHDTGVVLNRLTLQGQVDGGVVNGLGFALMEDNPLVDGKMATLHFGDFKIPCARDIPKLGTVLLESATGPTPYAGKAIAEMPNVPTAAAIANAVADATGIRIFDLPITAEKVYWALQQKS